MDGVRDYMLAQPQDAGSSDRQLQQHVCAIGADRTFDIDRDQLAIDPKRPARRAGISAQGQARMMNEIRGFDRLSVTGKITRTCANDTGDIDDLARNKSGVVERPHAQRDVHVFADEIDNAIGHHEVDRYVRMARGEVGQRRRKETGGNHRKRVHAQVSARRRARRRDLGLGRLDGPEYVTYAMQIVASLGGQRQPPCRPIDQPHAEAMFQAGDELRHGGWRQAYVGAAPAKLPRAATRSNVAISVGEVAIREIPSRVSGTHH
jgi:hypothetical protein